MKLHFEDKNTSGQFTVITGESFLKATGILNCHKESVNTIVCNTHGHQKVVIDQIPYTLPADSVLPLVSNQHFVFEQPENLVAWQFNRDFYCIADHDAEVGCVGFLFYGIEHPLFVKLSPAEVESISLIEKLCVEDMQIKDNMQGEMLRTLLKRLIINVTRIAKKQTENYTHFSDEKMDVVRMFNLLLEANFRKEHEVQFYANTLNKSPKTLANLFAIFNYPAPLKLIHRRIILEAKRYLNYTDISAKEIAYALGFKSSAHFSRFFKQNSGSNISLFRNQVT
ncbi:MAG: helix-turn-helix domain-containing protein [Chitinophagaceae bacterium]